LTEVTTVPAFSGWTDENYESPPRISNVSAETQIRYLPNVSLEECWVETVMTDVAITSLNLQYVV
jgi:hypothetical protein